MKRLNLTLFGVPFVGIELSATDSKGKTIAQAARETVSAAKTTVHQVASSVADATNDESRKA